MIDSSGTVEPTGGFDLERARGLRDFLQDDCAEVGDVWAEMIAEIERLRADAEQYTISIEARLDVIDQQAAQIRELEDALEEAQESLTEAYLLGSHKKAKELASRIKELEDALVEERARRDHGMIRGSSCKFYDTSKCEQDHGNFCGFVGCPHKTDFLKFANRQLQAEGKIGPDAKPHCWQITEERKAAIKELSELLTAIGCPSCHYYIQKNYGENITVLRAMLTEAA